jgi:hypothetical protein
VLRVRGVELLPGPAGEEALVMAMHAFCQGGIAATQKDLAKLRAALETATRAREPVAWRYIAEALGHVVMAQARLDDVVAIDTEMRAKEEAE